MKVVSRGVIGEVKGQAIRHMARGKDVIVVSRVLSVSLEVLDCKRLGVTWNNLRWSRSKFAKGLISQEVQPGVSVQKGFPFNTLGERLESFDICDFGEEFDKVK